MVWVAVALGSLARAVGLDSGLFRARLVRSDRTMVAGSEQPAAVLALSPFRRPQSTADWISLTGSRGLDLAHWISRASLSRAFTHGRCTQEVLALACAYLSGSQLGLVVMRDDVTSIVVKGSNGGRFLLGNVETTRSVGLRKVSRPSKVTVTLNREPVFLGLGFVSA